MADASFERSRSLGRPLMGYMFELTFGNVDGLNQDIKDISLLVESVDTPSKSVSEVTQDFLQHRIRSAGKVTKDGTVTITFKVQKDMLIVDLIEDWMDLITDNFTGEGVDLSDYATTITMKQLDDKPGDANNELYQYEYLLAYPQERSAISHSQTDEDPITMDVTFAYSNYNRELITGNA